MDGFKTSLQAFCITDANGGGNNYFLLRDLGQALNFNVGYDAETGTVLVETDKPYDAAN